MNRSSGFCACRAFAALFLAVTPAAAQNGGAETGNVLGTGDGAPREIMGSTSAVPGDRTVCLYDKPSRKMICRTFDQWRLIGIQRSAKRDSEKNSER